jgi:hypothetical protein
LSLNPTQKTKVRKEIPLFCHKAEANRLRWSYTQQRPFGGYMVDPSAHHANDCSGYVSLAFNWAMHKCGIYLQDPLGYHYTGYGYTGSMLRTDAAPSGKYLVGDWALWGPSIGSTSHTAICTKAGNDRSAVFSSNGHESWQFGSDAPNPITIASFPEHFLGVWRHPALK